MTAAPEPNSKPPFLRRRWPFFVLGFLLALPAPNLAWRAFEHWFYGGPTITVTLIEIDRPAGNFRLMDRSIAGGWPPARFADRQVVETHPVRTADTTAQFEIAYVDDLTREIRAAKVEIALDPRGADCRVIARHREHGIEISPCLPFVRGY
jgi:hypothetical protein